MENKAKKGKTKKVLAAAIRNAGTLLLILLVLLCVPLTVPRYFGYQIYSVISGSMEPEMPVGSLIYIGTGEPSEIEQGDVIVFYGANDSASIITHRVVENRTLMGEFITKGDANQTEDMNPVPYENYIGKVVYFIPRLGLAAEIFTSRTGKTAAGGVIIAAVLLHILASLLEKETKTKKDVKTGGSGE